MICIFEQFLQILATYAVCIQNQQAAEDFFEMLSLLNDFIVEPSISIALLFKYTCFSWKVNNNQQYNMQKSQWTQREKKIISVLVYNQGKQDWNQIRDFMNAKFPQNSYSSKQCRQWWKKNHPNNKNKKKYWNTQQQNLLFSTHIHYGNKWKIIADRFPQRSVNDVKNHFYSLLRKRLRVINKKLVGLKNSTIAIKAIKPSAITDFISDYHANVDKISSDSSSLDQSSKFIDLLVNFDEQKLKHNSCQQFLNFLDKLNLLSLEKQKNIQCQNTITVNQESSIAQNLKNRVKCKANIDNQSQILNYASQEQQVPINNLCELPGSKLQYAYKNQSHSYDHKFQIGSLVQNNFHEISISQNYFDDDDFQCNNLSWSVICQQSKHNDIELWASNINISDINMLEDDYQAIN